LNQLKLQNFEGLAIRLLGPQNLLLVIGYWLLVISYWLLVGC